MRVIKDESGQTLVLFAVFMGLIAIGFLAFALDVGTLFHQKRMAQAAADAAALAAAANPSNQQAAATAVAKLNGFDTTLATNPASVSVTTPASGNYVGTGYVQATVSKPIPTIFLSAFSHDASILSVSGQAIAGGHATPTCVCLEGTSGQDLYMYGGSTLTATNCGVVVNSSGSNAISLTGGATLGGLSLGTVSSTWNNSSNINNGGKVSSSTTIVQGITSTCSPTMPVAPTYSSCVADPGGTSSSFVAGPISASGTICYNSLTVGANNTLDTLNPGTYVIKNGTLHFESGSGGHSNLGGDGVFFYLVGTATILIDNGANVNLVAGGNTESGGATAPTVGIYNGILVYQATGDSAAISMQGGASAYMDGAVYAPSAAVTMGNGSGATIIGGIVANTLTMYGGGSINANAATNEGSLATSSPKLVQ